MHLITGKKGEPHITAENHGFINAQILGNGNFVFDFGNNFNAVKLNDNSVEIKDGQGMFGGRHFEIEYGTTENVTIENGTLGLNRKDLIVARYAKDSEGIETLELAVKKGTAVSGNPVDPYYDTRTPYTGADGGEFPLWRVNIVGTTIESLEPVYDIVDFDFAQLQLDIQTALGEFDDAMDTINGKSNKDNTPKVWAGSGDPFTVADDTEWPESSEIKVGDIYVKTATNEFYFVKLVASGGQGAAKLPQWVKLLTATDIANKPTEFKGSGDPFTVPTTTEEEQVKVGDIYVKSVSGNYYAQVWICYKIETAVGGAITAVHWQEVAFSYDLLKRIDSVKFFYGEGAPTTQGDRYPDVRSGDIYIETGTGDYYSGRRVNSINGLWIAKISNSINLSWEEVALTKNTIKRDDGIKVFYGTTDPTQSLLNGSKTGDIYIRINGNDRDVSQIIGMWIVSVYPSSGTYYWQKIPLGDYYTKTETDTLLNAKQDTLTAGEGIDITDNTVSLVSPTYDDVPIPNSKYEACAKSDTGVEQLYRGIKIPHNTTINNGSIIGVVINDPSYVKDEYVTIKYQLEYTPADIDLSYYLNLGINAVKIRDGLYELTKTLHITDYANKTQRRSYVATRSRSHATEDIIVRLGEVKVVNATKEEYENAKLIYDNVQQNGETITLYMRTNNDSYGVEWKNFVDLCTNIKDSSPKKIYNVIFREGVYELYDLLDLTNIVDQAVGKRGCELPNYFNIEGLGNVTIKCTLPDTETNEHVQAISTLNMTGWNTIKNINLEITNGRYVVHDDNGTVNNDIVIFDNVTMTHNGNTIGLWNSRCCYGAGYREGRNATFKNCIFTGDKDTFYVHNTNIMRNPFTLMLSNCVFNTSDTKSVRLDNVYTSNFKNSITLNNCKLDTDLSIEGSYDVFKIFVGGGNNFTITNTAGNTVYRV